jgi:hypothetical protein
LRRTGTGAVDMFRTQVVQSPHLRDQVCHVIDVDEGIVASTSRF